MGAAVVVDRDVLDALYCGVGQIEIGGGIDREAVGPCTEIDQVKRRKLGAGERDVLVAGTAYGILEVRKNADREIVCPADNELIAAAPISAVNRLTSLEFAVANEEVVGAVSANHRVGAGTTRNVIVAAAAVDDVVATAGNDI